ncbi:GYDIA family GHMP kinase [Salinimicrobium xinjiangense]|uniref:GYDIA family GHMP kinase n=1 Tax=Salinimicrobium xinjiangense TaxID=438596 RepID=UPI000415D23F|nr:GYDIA family GHMP kinase [Salinimicrobium xinjiangense]
MQKFHSHGKLLISGEYLVLDGATALALPTKPGQSLEVVEIEEPVIKWKSIDSEGNIWFEENYKMSDLQASSNKSTAIKDEVSKMLFLTLFSAAQKNKKVLNKANGYQVTSTTEFPLDWGLGTSSTLVANIAKWFDINVFELLADTFGGSGYDVAVALHGSPVTFEKQGAENSILKTSFDPPFKDQIFFIHLNQKQNSRESIKHYREQEKRSLDTAIEKISALTHSIITCTSLTEFNLLLELHENIISQQTGLQKVKSKLFPDYPGAIKSLGGWGGDFILATGNAEDMEYFRKKGYNTILAYSDIILQ